MSDVRPDQIGAVLDAVVGSTGIEGDTTLDGESMRNVPKLEAVCEWLYGRIESAHRGDYPSVGGSVVECTVIPHAREWRAAR